MDRNLVIETAYETIRDSLEWSYGEEDSKIASYISGITDMTDKLLEKLEELSTTDTSESEKWITAEECPF